MKKFVIILLFLLSGLSLSGQCNPIINSEIALLVRESPEFRLYGTFETGNVVKAELGFGYVTDLKRLGDITFFVRNKFKVVEQNNFNVYIVPFWLYGYFTQHLGKDIYNSFEVDYSTGKWLFSISVDYKYTNVYEFYNADKNVSAFITLKRKLF